MPQYLSTDPNAGTPVEAGGYLSTDPNAGEPAPDFKTETTATESGFGDFLTGASGKPSVAGFAKNVLTSGVNFAKDLTPALMNPSKVLVDGATTAATHPILTAKAIRDAVIKRYGSVDAFLGTLYTDPVGAASDASMVAGGVTAASKGAGLTKLARVTGGAAEALNPLGVVAKGLEEGGRAAYGAAINPSRRIRRGFPAAIDEGYRRNTLPTEGGLRRTENALEQSAANTQSLLAEADAKGAPGVNVRAQVVPNLKEPAVQAGKRYKLGKADERIDVSQRAKNLAARNKRPIPLTDANKLKQEAQSLADGAYRAQERGALIKDLDALSDKHVAEAFRKAIENNAISVGVEGVKESNRQTQSLIGLAQALEDATQQPSRLTHLMSTLGAVGGGIAAGTGGGVMAYGAARLATAKPVMAAAGIAAGKGASKLTRHAQILRALAVLSAANRPEGETDQK